MFKIRNMTISKMTLPVYQSTEPFHWPPGRYVLTGLLEDYTGVEVESGRGINHITTFQGLKVRTIVHVLMGGM